MRSLREIVDRQLITALVARDITCKVSGKVLDVRTAVVFRDADGDPALVVSPEGYEELDREQYLKTPGRPRLTQLLAAGYTLDESTVPA